MGYYEERLRDFSIPKYPSLPQRFDVVLYISAQRGAYRRESWKSPSTGVYACTYFFHWILPHKKGFLSLCKGEALNIAKTPYGRNNHSTVTRFFDALSQYSNTVFFVRLSR